MSEKKPTRSAVHAAFINALGEEVAELVMESIPPFNWHEIATKSDIANLPTRAEFDHRFAELRADVDLWFAELRADFQVALHRGLNRTTLALIGVMVTMQATTIAAIALAR